MSLTVVAPGMLTLLQDAGRPGYGSSGVGRSGAFDRAALRQANLLVGNPAATPGLEILGGGVHLRATREHVFAVTGAVGSVLVDGHPVEHGRPFVVFADQDVTLGTFDVGLRAYLAVSGGLQADEVLGSCSTDTLSGPRSGAGGRRRDTAVRLSDRPTAGRSGHPRTDRQRLNRRRHRSRPARRLVHGHRPRAPVRVGVDGDADVESDRHPARRPRTGARPRRRAAQRALRLRQHPSHVGRPAGRTRPRPPGDRRISGHRRCCGSTPGPTSPAPPGRDSAVPPGLSDDRRDRQG